jgi:hypothetical protein
MHRSHCALTNYSTKVLVTSIMLADELGLAAALGSDPGTFGKAGFDSDINQISPYYESSSPTTHRMGFPFRLSTLVPCTALGKIFFPTLPTGDAVFPNAAAVAAVSDTPCPFGENAAPSRPVDASYMLQSCPLYRFPCSYSESCTLSIPDHNHR